MGKSTKRRHQSSSVEEVSPAVTRRTSRLTRSKKLKSTVKSSSPVLGKTTVKPRVTPRQQPQEAGPSTGRSNRRQSRRRLSRAHLLLDQDCVTPVRPRHGRSSHLHLTSPHTATYSESEPEIIWDDKSPNAVQLRRLGKGGKRSAVEDISDIINCVPEVAVDNVNSKPSLLSLWMTRDSPSPKPETKTTQPSTRHSKKTVSKKKTRKSRLSALTHELEKVISAIEPEEEEEQDEEEERQKEEERALASSKKLTDSKSATACSTTTPASSSAPTRVSTGSTSPTLYTQTKPTQKPTSPRRLPLPAVGRSPDGPEKPQEKQPFQDSKGSGSDESPPGSQTKWEAIGNASAEELWGDDDMFDDDGFLMETIEVEIASSQMVQSTPVRRVRKRPSLKGANSVCRSDSDSDAPTLKPPTKPSAPIIPATSSSSDNSKPKTFVRATSKSAIQSRTVTANNGKPISSSCPTVTKTTASGPTSNTKSFVAHEPNSKPGFQLVNKQVSATTVSRPSGSAPSSSASQMNPTRSAAYSLRPGNKAAANAAKHQVSKPPAKVPMSTSAIVNSTQSYVSSSASVLSQSTSSTSITRTNPPSVTRVVHSTDASINQNTPASNKSIPSSNKFVPFRSEPQSSTAKNSTQNIAPVSSMSTLVQNSQSYTNSNRAPATASKAYVPYQNNNAVQKPSSSTASAADSAQPSKFFAAHQGTASQHSKPFVAHQTIGVQQSKSFARHQGTTGQQSKSLTAHQGTANQQPKSFVRHKETAVQEAKPIANQQSKSLAAHQGTASQQSKSFVPFSKESAQNKNPKTALHGAKSQPSGQMNSSKVYVPFKKVPQTQHSATLASCGKPPSTGANPQHFVTGGKPGQTTTQIAPSSCGGQVPTSNSTLVNITQSSQQTFTSSQNGGNAKPKSFVPFKKPQSVTDVSRKPSSASSTGSITSVPSKSNLVVKRGTSGYASQAKCSNNNVDLGKAFSPNKGPLNRSTAIGGNKNQASKVNSAGTTPATTSVEGGQFDDSLPDEMLMSLVDMDDSWDQF